MKLQFSIKSSTHYLRFLRQLMVTAAGMGPKIKHEAVVACSLALVEAVNNAIFHAHRKDYEKWIDIVINVYDSSIEMEVADTGPGFDMPEFDMPPVDHIHGRGLFIIKSMMHEVKYKRGSKNVLRMVYCF